MLMLWGFATAATSGCAPRPEPGLARLVDGVGAVSPGIPGIAVAVVDRQGVRLADASGVAVVADAARRGRAMTADTPVRVASVSKLVLTLGVMRLVEQGRLDLDRDVSIYLGWRLRNPAFPDRPITLRQMLSHTSTLVDGPGYSFALGTSLRESITADRWHGSHPPGSWFNYSNLNFGVVATVMEAATGERFDRLMQRLVLQPLALDACFNWSGCSPAAFERAGVLYRKGADETHWAPTGPWIAQIDDRVPPACPVRRADDSAACVLDGYRPGTNGTLFSPQGGLRISVLGLGKIARLLLNDGEVDGVRLLRPESVRAMLTPVWRMTDGSASGDTYGGQMRCYGLSVQCLVGDAGAGRGDQPLPDRTVRWFGHLGDAYGLYSGLWIDPVAGRGYVYVVTGTADDPAKYPGRYSGFRAYEEAILARLVEAGR